MRENPLIQKWAHAQRHDYISISFNYWLRIRNSCIRILCFWDLSLLNVRPSVTIASKEYYANYFLIQNSEMILTYSWSCLRCKISNSRLSKSSSAVVHNSKRILQAAWSHWRQHAEKAGFQKTKDAVLPYSTVRVLWQYYYTVYMHGWLTLPPSLDAWSV